MFQRNRSVVLHVQFKAVHPSLKLQFWGDDQLIILFGSKGTLAEILIKKILHVCQKRLGALQMGVAPLPIFDVRFLLKSDDFDWKIGKIRMNAIGYLLQLSY